MPSNCDGDGDGEEIGGVHAAGEPAADRWRRLATTGFDITIASNCDERTACRSSRRPKSSEANYFSPYVLKTRPPTVANCSDFELHVRRLSIAFT